jgi:hypothetical protein
MRKRRMLSTETEVDIRSVEHVLPQRHRRWQLSWDIAASSHFHLSPKLLAQACSGDSKKIDLLSFSRQGVQVERVGNE